MIKILAILLTFLSFGVLADEVCQSTDSSFVHQVCYDKERAVLRLLLKDKFYQYCGVSPAVHASLLDASSIGTFFNQYIKGRYRC